MKSFLQAIYSVSRMKGNVHDGMGRELPTPWQMVLARTLMGLLWGLCGFLVLWLVPGDRYVGVILGTLAVQSLRLWSCRPEERKGILEALSLLMPKAPEKTEDISYRQACFDGLLLVRPLCIYVILLGGNWLWLPAAAALSMALSLDEGNRKYAGLHWFCAVSVSLLCGAIGSRAFPGQGGMFIMSILAAAICWMMSPVLDVLKLRTSRECTLFIGETVAFILGMLGQAML